MPSPSLPVPPPVDYTSSPFPSAKGRRKVPAVKGLLGHKNVALGSLGLGSVTLVRYHNFIPHVALCKVNPEVGPTQRPTQAPIYWEPEPGQIFL